MKQKIDMDKRAREFREHTGGYVNPVAAAILQQQLYRVECRRCGTVFECAEGSDAYKSELCRECRQKRAVA